MLRRGLVAGCALAIGACSGGGGSSGVAGGTVQGLQIPSNFSLVTPQGGGAQGASLHAGAGRTQLLAFSDAGTDYSTDVRQVYVHDDSMEALGTINMILCMLDQTGAAGMVNKGPYIALVNTDRCDQSHSSGNSQQGPSSGGAVAQFARWVVNVTRADNASPELVHIWLPNPDKESGSGNILVDMTVTEGVSDAHPFGSFRMSFQGVADGAQFGRVAGTAVTTMKGMLETVDNPAGKPQFRFVNVGGDILDASLNIGHGDEEAANVRLDDATGSGGLGRTRQHNMDSHNGQTSSSESEYAVAYNVTRFLAARDDNGDQVPDLQVCRARDQFDTHIWRYMLYHQNDGTFRGTSVTGGQRVALDAGFPFSLDSNTDGTDDTYGFVGYQGVWLESQQAVPDGQAIHRFDYQTGVTTPYTLRVSKGRLTRRSAVQELLSDFAGVQFSWWGQHPVLGIFGQWAVVVDANEDLQLIGVIQDGQNGPTVAEVLDQDNNPATPPVAVAAPLVLADGATVSLWSPQASGGVVYNFDSAVAAASRMVTLYNEEMVAPGDATLFAGNPSVTLYCYQNCLIGGMDQAAIAAAAGNEQALYHPWQGQPWTYTLASASGKLTLTDDSNSAAVDATALDLNSVGHSWGVDTGQMLTAPLADPTKPWLSNDADVGYRWESGPNSWNQLVMAVDAQGVVATFDKPLQFAYVHATQNDANADPTFAGQHFQLNYGGEGQLGGLPASNDGNGRWMPQINLADGVVLTDGSNSFVLRGLEMEQVMKQVDMSLCAGLDVSAVYSDTSMALPTSADIVDVSFSLADEPVVTDAPAVVDGVVQTAAPTTSNASLVAR